jgi:hypothetical protein
MKFLIQRFSKLSVVTKSIPELEDVSVDEEKRLPVLLLLSESIVRFIKESYGLSISSKL